MKILFAVDLSEPPDLTDEVVDFVKRLSADLLVLHVHPQKPAASPTPLDATTGLGGFSTYMLYDPGIEQDIMEAQEHAFASFIASRFRYPVQAALREGNPSEVILEDAEKHQVDLVVLGKRHHSRIGRLLLGSVASAVIEHAKRPTLLMPILNE